MLRAVFFDIDDTLFSTTEFSQHAREKAVEAMIRNGLQISREEALRELRGVVEEFGSNDDRHFNRLLDRLPRAATAEANRTLLVVAGVMAYHETKWKELHIIPASRRLLEDLVRTDLKLGIITSGLTNKQMEKILRLGLQKVVHPKHIFITDQLGIAKSNPKLYRLAARRTGVKPAEAMHVGDHPLNDVQTSKRAGFIATWHHGSGKYAWLKPDTPPDHIINNVEELRGILTGQYSVPLGA